MHWTYWEAKGDVILISSVGIISVIIINMVSFVEIGYLIIGTVQVLVTWIRLEEKWLGKSTTKGKQVQSGR